MISEMTYIQSLERMQVRGNVVELVDEHHVLLLVEVTVTDWTRLLQVPPVWFEFMTNGALSYNLASRGMQCISYALA